MLLINIDRVVPVKTLRAKLAFSYAEHHSKKIERLSHDRMSPVARDLSALFIMVAPVCIDFVGALIEGKCFGPFENAPSKVYLNRWRIWSMSTSKVGLGSGTLDENLGMDVFKFIIFIVPCQGTFFGE